MASAVSSRLCIWLSDGQKDGFVCVEELAWRKWVVPALLCIAQHCGVELGYCCHTEPCQPMGIAIRQHCWHSQQPQAGHPGYSTRTGTVGNPHLCADCVKYTPFPRAYRRSYKRSKDGRNDIPLLIIVCSHLYIWCYVTNSSLLFASRKILLQVGTKGTGP